MRKWLMILFSFLLILYFIFIYIYFQREIKIEVISSDTLVLNINESFASPSAKASYCGKYFKNNCINISSHIQQSDNIDIHELGDYHINYYVKYKGESKSVSIPVEVVDLDAPEIKLHDLNKLTLCPNCSLDILSDYTVTDNYDDRVEVIKYIEGNQIYYKAIDTSGNTSIVSKEVEIVDREKPTIQLSGDKHVYMLKGNSYKELGAIANDNCDGNISANVIIDGFVNTEEVGNYIITYTIKDSSGNENRTTREVYVYESTIGSNVLKNGKIVYLTFDDGPNSYTENILKVLDKYQVKATFFVTNQFSNYQYLIKDIYEAGHSIGIHTYSHNYKKIYKSEEDFFADFYKMDEIIYQYTNGHTKLFRFPGGSSNTISRFNKGIISRLSLDLQEKGYTYFDWNVDSRDTSTNNSITIANNIINGIKSHNQSVVLMHDIKPANGQALEKVLIYGLLNGYTFLPLDENSPTAQHIIVN